MSSLSTILQDIASLPSDRAMGIPGAFYTDEEYFHEEVETILRRGWHSLGRVDEIPNSGDFFTAQLLNEPLLIVRQSDAEIVVLANVCRHRGMPLAEGTGSTKRFICSYHAWTYDLDGILLRAPRMKNAGFESKNCGLYRHNSHIWNGFIYVNLSAEVKPFEHPSLTDLLSNYETEKFKLAHVEEEIWNTNWKCLVENFMEGYHLSVVHPETLHDYTPTGLARKLLTGYGFTSYAANYPKNTPQRGLGGPNLTEDERLRSTLFSIFPTQVVSQAASLLVSLSIFPLNAGQIKVKWTLSTYSNDLDESTIADRVALWQKVNQEDREKLERLQVSLSSYHAGSGPLAEDDYEGTIRDFQLWLAAHYQT
ncbi:aromatic ring-hydroxylating dioxygenase subunit alpha [Amylibacter sp.]|jgi:phenylpropionate dioxygenase-like ring-hydroxylating dioxygenase large terminal subunit|nr:aromatic ring-hydroxylating dioxygenase subunit alpha [Rhodobacterales bacterium]MDA7740052.1 aromatic ring-hydroxylating dioxygenase subunit alpha [Amylibacter sp.]MBT6008868.1 aromatic ring-hydroxylating dioxygenase subunit alpha [Rhodobacterales bacterium]MBT6832585.1 aromatic ring-hydroxylating dioxygenase subunit alpha [Rhodobacterales bacterium]MDA8645322.1 aromatic ring-hydroxylating dioxygenase subunit alpha [Amylibacter sp.]|tara:strand:- start:4628 stop:5725 length:1098 start_codon:yes stop_codon:yes gene_type:complete